MEYRYHRMTDNSAGWRQPIAGRLGKTSDYPGETGFGHEDWNFSRDVWSDGRCHLYLRSQPAAADRTRTFNIVLGICTPEGHFAVGFCENATYAISELDKDLLKVRAEQLHALDLAGDLRGQLQGLSVKEKALRLMDDGEVYWVSVKQADLIELNTFSPIPESTLSHANHHRYMLYRLDEAAYKSIRLTASDYELPTNPDETLFPEGAIVARTHLLRERNPAMIRKAKADFIAKHGGLHCETCNHVQTNNFPNPAIAAAIIEAHHDVPLYSPEHGGKTQMSDIRMLCPNCHRALHRHRPWLKVDAFRKKFFP